MTKESGMHIADGNCWAMTGFMTGLAPMREGFHFVLDAGGSIDAPEASPTGRLNVITSPSGDEVTVVPDVRFRA